MMTFSCGGLVYKIPKSESLAPLLANGFSKPTAEQPYAEKRYENIGVAQVARQVRENADFDVIRVSLLTNEEAFFILADSVTEDFQRAGLLSI